MSNVEIYDARVRAIRAYNEPLLDDFEAWLEQSGLSEKTVVTHGCLMADFSFYVRLPRPLAETLIK